MPVRYFKCIYCGHRMGTFMTDDELEGNPLSCPKCECPYMDLEKRPE